MMLIMGGASALGNIFGATAQSNAASAATNAQMAMFNRIQQTMAPYTNFGANWGIPGYQQATQTFENAIPGLSAGLTAQDIQNTPGYQFMLQQGNESIAARNAAAGLGSSGNVLKDFGNYNTQLAMTTIPQWMQLLMNQKQQQYNMLQGGITPFQSAVNAGLSAGGTLGQFGTTAATNVGQYTVGAGNAQAAAGMNFANTVAGMPGQYMGYSLMNQLLGQNPNTAQSATAMGVPTGMPGGPGAGVNPLMSSSPLGLPGST
jgi:hypothetical protein